MVLVQDLLKLSLFRECSPMALERLAKDMEIKTYHMGEMVLVEGQQSEALYFIVSGSARVEKALDKSQDRSKVVARLLPDEIFGEMSFLEQKPLSASIVADADLVVYVLHRRVLQQLAKSDAAAALEQVLTIFSGISRRLRRTTIELVTVFEVARLLMLELPFHDVIQAVLHQLFISLGETTAVGFYRWNQFNDEFDLVSSVHIPGGGPFPANFPKEVVGTVLASSELKVIQFGKDIEGLLVFSDKTAFDSGARQMIDTVSGLLAPALSTWRLREEEQARVRFERSRGENLYS